MSDARISDGSGSPPRYRSVFSPSRGRERRDNFEAYWNYTLARDGAILEVERDLERKKALVAAFRAHPVRSRAPLPDPARFYENCVHLRADARRLDRKTLFFTFLYKFARHEWVGISAAWDETPTIGASRTVKRRISRYHLCEEFCHLRLFDEMFRTFHLDHVEWVPLGKWMGRLYRVFPHVPGPLMAPAAFVTELMGLMFYLHIDRRLDDLLADEPEARGRLRELLREIMTDEMSHVGQRRNFLGPLGVRVARGLVAPMVRMFCRDLPEVRHLFDVDRLVSDARGFDYSTMAPAVLEQGWVPSYLKPPGAA
ncbi:MAG TPA: hypothetical protein VJU81_00480 [Methylomirabilota bacterium]|nr:hypothetical protein [Methylomirabilota bacterium]